MTSEKHQFAIYRELPSSEIKDIIKIEDQLTYHRIIRVLRLKVNDDIIIFNADLNLLAEIIKIEKHSITLKIIKKNKNKPFKPKITIFLSLLKKESFQEALYFCVELGVNIIQPIITEKSHIKKISNNDYERFKKIIISAAEQSKNFNIPELKSPLLFEETISKLAKTEDTKIYFDSEGKNLLSIINETSKNPEKDIILMVGPEGDLTNNEKQIAKDANFTFCALTPTILRAHIAACLSIGIFRSIFK